ncbi:MAG: T9SS type A sorting domain-containing protein [Chitinophagales bacterium]
MNIQTNKAIHENNYLIYDYQGNLILTGKLISENTFVDISSLSNGLYLLKIDDHLGEIFKVLKQ